MAGSRSILVVGERRSASEVLEAAKQRPHWAVEHARSGSEGIASAEAGRHDVVVTALDLPDMDGLALLTGIRASRPKAKIIVLADESPPARIIEAIREHVFSFFSEPLDLESVLRAVERALTIPDWEDGIEVVSALPHWIDLRVRCRKVSGERLENFLRAFRLDLPPQEQENVAIAFREMLLNAIEHGGAGDPERTVEVSYVRTSRLILYLIADPGEGFSFDSIPHAAISNPADSPTAHIDYRSERGMRAGGFGILVSRELVDELVYNEKGNRVIMIKYLASEDDRGDSRLSGGD